MSQVGDLYFIDRDKRTSWIAEVDQLGFTVEDMSERLTESERSTFAFLGKLKNEKKERLVDLQTWEQGYVLAVRFADRDDPEFLKRTIGSRFPRPPEPKKK
ncbi:MAG: hypothetical protein QM760_11400 [Nibricoccus sp.]